MSYKIIIKKSKALLSSALSLCLLTFLSSCTYDKKEPSAPNIDDCLPETITFTKDIQPLIEQHCIGCHGQSFPNGGLALTNFNQVRQATENGILLQCIALPPSNSLAMPPGQGLSDCENEIFQEWKNSGFIEF